jgi:hypothetical protein
VKTEIKKDILTSQDEKITEKMRVKNRENFIGMKTKQKQEAD